MNEETRRQFRRRLEDLHLRVAREVNQVVESLRDDVTVSEEVSSAPVHLADVAADDITPAVNVLHAERSLLEQIDAALARLEAGSFGKCLSCGRSIPEERLSAIPYADVCVRCARENQPADEATHASGGK